MTNALAIAQAFPCAAFSKQRQDIKPILASTLCGKGQGEPPECCHLSSAQPSFAVFDESLSVHGCAVIAGVRTRSTYRLHAVMVAQCTLWRSQIETQGRVGKATWRLVSAPLIPGLLSLDPTVDHTHLLSSLDMGSEFEVQFGKSLQVTFSAVHELKNATRSSRASAGTASLSRPSSSARPAS